MEGKAAKTGRRALEGITVLEWAQRVAGPFCGRLLADMGAEVVKVEPPDGDASRRHGPFLNSAPDPETSALFLYVNANKMSVTLDPTTPRGAELFRRLAATSDILIEDRQPGEMQSLGLDYQSLRQANAGLVYASITPFGQTGPYAGYRAYDLNIFCAGGEANALPGSLSNQLFPGREPVRAGEGLADYDAAMTASVAIVSALLARDLSGAGQHLDISRQDAAMALTRETIQRYTGYGEVVTRDRAYFLGGIFQCRDGYVALFPREDRHWLSLCEVMGRDDLSRDERFSDLAGRSTHKDILNAALQEWVEDKPMMEVYEKASDGGCPAGYYATAAEVAASAQMASRGFFVELEHPRAGRLSYPTSPYNMSETMPSTEQAAPLLGEHNAEVFGRRLGLAAEEMNELRRGGVI